MSYSGGVDIMDDVLEEMAVGTVPLNETRTASSVQMASDLG